jgi:hypothetical protein
MKYLLSPTVTVMKCPTKFPEEEAPWEPPDGPAPLAWVALAPEPCATPPPCTAAATPAAGVLAAPRGLAAAGVPADPLPVPPELPELEPPGETTSLVMSASAWEYRLEGSGT